TVWSSSIDDSRIEKTLHHAFLDLSGMSNGDIVTVTAIVTSDKGEERECSRTYRLVDTHAPVNIENEFYLGVADGASVTVDLASNSSSVDWTVYPALTNTSTDRRIVITPGDHGGVYTISATRQTTGGDLLCSCGRDTAQLTIVQIQANPSLDINPDLSAYGEVILLGTNVDDFAVVGVNISPTSITNYEGTFTLLLASGVENITTWRKDGDDNLVPAILPQTWSIPSGWDDIWREIYLEGVETSGVQEVALSLSYENSTITDVDTVAFTVLDLNFDVFKTDKSELHEEEKEFGLFIQKNINDSDADGVRDCDDFILNSPADTNEMAMIKIAHIPQLASLSGWKAEVSVDDYYVAGLFSGDDTNQCSITNITSQLQDGDVQIFIEGVDIGTAAVCLKLYNEDGNIAEEYSIPVAVVPFIADSDEDGIASYRSTSIDSMSVSVVDAATGLTSTRVPVGMTSPAAALCAINYITAWHVPGVDESFLRKTTSSFLSRIITQSDDRTGILRPGGRVVWFDGDGKPISPDDNRTYRLVGS
ncbi:MAG: hypothetical protein KAI74_06800, partial [Kiritimatiellae bacterium]|nr:hypothetical protein [Kiritimatiellia bacterium]